MDFMRIKLGHWIDFWRLSRQSEDLLRAAIEAYTEAVTDKQAKEDAADIDDDLEEAVKVVSNLVEWGNNVASRTGMEPWEDAQKFLDQPLVKAIREQLKLAECKDHWHCAYNRVDPEFHAQDEKADRTKPCPSCKQPPDRDVFTTRCLETLRAMKAVIAWPFRDRSSRAYRFSDEATDAVVETDAVLAEGKRKGLI